MGGRRVRTFWLGALIVGVVAAPAPALGGPSAPQADTPIDCVIPGWDDRCERWSHRYAEGEPTPPFGDYGTSRAAEGALSPSGSRAFVVGYRIDGSRVCPGNPPVLCQDLQTVAYDTATGNVLWVKHEPPPWESAHSFPRTVVVSADGTTVFVVGTVLIEARYAKDRKQDIQVIAYDAATGARRWAVLYDGPAGMPDDAFAATAAPSGSGLHIGATSTSRALPTFERGYSPLYMTRGTMAAGFEDVDTDFALLTYDGATGDLVDEQRYGGDAFMVDGELHGSWDIATDIEVSPDGERILMAGLSDGREGYKALKPYSAVVSWRATDDGSYELDWAREVAGLPLGLGSFPSQGMVAFAGAYGQGGTESNPYAVVGLDAESGSPRWETRYALGGIGNHLESPRGLIVDRPRGLVHLPGLSRFPSSSYGTLGSLALRAADGTQAWRTRVRDPRSNATIIFNYDADSMPVGTLDPVSGNLQLGSTREGKLATFSLNGATGALRWSALFEDPVRPGTKLEQSGYDWPVNMEAAGGTAVVFGNSYMQYRDTCPYGSIPLPCSRDHYLTVAYEV